MKNYTSPQSKMGDIDKSDDKRFEHSKSYTDDSRPGIRKDRKNETSSDRDNRDNPEQENDYSERP